MHGQAQNTLRCRFGHREASWAVPERSEDRLKMKRHGVMHGRRNATRPHASFHPLTLRYLDGVLRIDARAAVGNEGRRDAMLLVLNILERIANQLAVSCTDAA